MFWRYNLITGSCIETLLDKENVTLKELMDEEDILQECKAQTKKLLDYLVRPDILDNTVHLMITEPELEDDEKQRYRYANRACELLTFDNPQIYDALAKEEVILKKLYNFLETDETLNPLLASFFSKTMGLLITKKTEIMYNFLKDTDFLSLVLKHLDTSAIMDLLLRFITIENDEMRATVIKWLNEQKLIQQLIKRIDLEYSEDVNCNASHTLCDIIKMSREHMSLLQEKAHPNPLLEAIESVEVISELLNHLFKDVSKEHAIVTGIPVLLSLLSFKKQGLGGVQQVPANNTEPPLQADNAPTCFSSLCKNETEQMTALDAERLACSVLNALTAIIPRLEDFHNLLLNPPLKPAIKLTIGSLDPPFGNCRLEVAHLITALLHTNNHLVNVKLAELETFIVLMDLFFEYPWNNFLHTQVAQAVGRIFSNAPTVDKEGNKVHPLLHQMLLKYKITVKVLECFEEKLSETGMFVSKLRSLDLHQKGYMGHLTKIANHIAQNTENSVNSNLIKEKMKELPEEHCKKWKEFVTDKLAEINKKNTLLVVSPVHSVQSASADECVDFRELPFTKDSSEPLAFSDFQMHEMTSHFIDQFGFNDDDEDEYDLSKQNLLYGKSTVNPLSQNFQMTWDGAEMKSSELFDEVCRSKINPDDTLWIERDRFDYETRYHLRANRSVEENNSSDSDEESQVFEAESSPIVLTSEEVKMDVDNQEAIFDGVPMDVAPVTIPNPWGESTGTTSTPDDQGNWADFSSFAAISTPTSDQSEVVNSSISVAMETSDSASVKFCSSDMSSVKVEDSVSNEMNRLEVTLKEKHKDSLGVFEETSKNGTV